MFKPCAYRWGMKFSSPRKRTTYHLLIQYDSDAHAMEETTKDMGFLFFYSLQVFFSAWSNKILYHHQNHCPLSFCPLQFTTTRSFCIRKNIVKKNDTVLKKINPPTTIFLFFTLLNLALIHYNKMTPKPCPIVFAEFERH